MAIVFSYYVCKLDGSLGKTYRDKTKAELYAERIKTGAEKIQITRTAKGYAPYVYYI